VVDTITFYKITLVSNMKNLISCVFILLFFAACQQKVEQGSIPYINGYWEVDHVIFEDGNKKDYPVNDSYDYFKIDANNSGFRKKVMPQFDGSFLVNDSQESIKVRFDDSQAFLDYQTAYTKWTEEIISISKEELVLKSRSNVEYHYKKAILINGNDNGKKIK
jgi:hypothetical protein